jgi:predicted SnoaL-like aldol condensation-catalyzing enzyme
MVKTILSSIALSILLWSCSTSQNKQSLTNKIEVKMETKSNKQKVIELLNSIENGDTKPVVYISPNNYKQHNLAVGDGLAGFGEVLSQLPKGSAKVEVIRAFEEGNYVFTHTKYNFFGPKAGFDIFRFEDGLIVEHWDNLQEIAKETVSGRTQFEGTTKIIDLSKTIANKELVKNFVSDVLMGANPSKITDYISTETYLQHNPNVGDGLAGLGKALEDLAKAGMPMKFTKNHRILGEGNFVLSVSEGEFLKKHVAFYDLFRIENGKIVEHWDTIEEILKKSQWKNNNGKF